MKKIIFLLLTSLIINFALAMDANNFVEQGKQAEERMDETGALELYKKALAINPTEISALCQAAIMCSNIGNRSNSVSVRDNYYKAATTYALTALKVDNQNAESNFAMAVVLGRKVYLENLPKARIRVSAKLKQYIDLAIKYNPQHYKALAILGMWHYERATLTFAEKKIVAMIGGLPNGDINTAKKMLEKSNELKPNTIITMLALGKVYKVIGETSSTRTIWSAAMNLPNEYKDDPDYKRELKRRLNQL